MRALITIEIDLDDDLIDDETTPLDLAREIRDDARAVLTQYQGVLSQYGAIERARVALQDNGQALLVAGVERQMVDGRPETVEIDEYPLAEEPEPEPEPEPRPAPRKRASRARAKTGAA